MFIFHNMTNALLLHGISSGSSIRAQARLEHCDQDSNLSRQSFLIPTST